MRESSRVLRWPKQRPRGSSGKMNEIIQWIGNDVGNGDLSEDSSNKGDKGA